MRLDTAEAECFRFGGSAARMSLRAACREKKRGGEKGREEDSEIGNEELEKATLWPLGDAGWHS